MAASAIVVQELGKSFLIGGIPERYHTLRDTISEAFSAPFSRKKKRSPKNTIFWALESVSFEVAQGEVVGLIGRNGAGKSTLLKILSRITSPTRGRAVIAGRVGSLMEVGTGFHPELTGYDNVFLNGAILGMRRTEISQKLDEIVAFAEVEKFINTPVKHYSSGMYLRLAFAVAAHLEPEVLLVDEVLAVGDARFQKKCLDRMREVGKEGRTVLFVSHNMPAVTHLCPRTILLDQGKVIKDGPSLEVVGLYMKSSLGTTAARQWEGGKMPGNDVVRLRSVRAVDEDGAVSEALDIRKPIRIEMDYEVFKPEVLTANYTFHNEEGICIFSARDLEPKWRDAPRAPGRYLSSMWIPGNFLAGGTVIVTAGLTTMKRPRRIHVLENDAIAFRVVDTIATDTARGDYDGNVPGAVRPIFRWTTGTP